MTTANRVWVTECPRDAMQGIHDFIPTELKIGYLNSLLKAGFDRLDFGSFVSPKAIPQLSDTREVLQGLDTTSTTRLLAIVANLRGAEEASSYEAISLLGYPFSVSETFQKRNTKSGIAASFDTVLSIHKTALNSGKELVVYISMAYGNPYGDEWNDEVVLNWILKLKNNGISKIALADTVGLAEAKDVSYLTAAVIREFPGLEVGAHLHCAPTNWREKVEAAFNAGCRHFDSAIKGYGGCPMAKDELVGNLATENLVQYLKEKNVETLIDPAGFNHAVHASNLVFLPAM